MTSQIRDGPCTELANRVCRESAVESKSHYGQGRNTRMSRQLRDKSVVVPIHTAFLVRVVLSTDAATAFQRCVRFLIPSDIQSPLPLNSLDLRTAPRGQKCGVSRPSQGRLKGPRGLTLTHHQRINRPVQPVTSSASGKRDTVRCGSPRHLRTHLLSCLRPLSKVGTRPSTVGTGQEVPVLPAKAQPECRFQPSEAKHPTPCLNSTCGTTPSVPAHQHASPVAS